MSKRTVHRADHPLSMAHSPTPAGAGETIYVVCGFDGCDQRRAVTAALWMEECARRDTYADAQRDLFPVPERSPQACIPSPVRSAATP
jgi:hypothetical protein